MCNIGHQRLEEELSKYLTKAKLSLALERAGVKVRSLPLLFSDRQHTGEKARVARRYMKYLYNKRKDVKEWQRAILQQKAGDVEKGEGTTFFLTPPISLPGTTPGFVRARYRDGYPPLDRFDREWYNKGVWYLPKKGHWKTTFVWNLLHGQVINARALYCASTDERITTDDYIAKVVQEWAYGD